MDLLDKFQYKKLETEIRQILDKVHLKHLIYRSILYPTQIIALYNLNKINHKTDYNCSNNNGKRILINRVDGRHMRLTYLESMIAKALQLRGHKPKILLCGGLLDMCAGHHTIDNPHTKWSCKDCIKFSKKFFDLINLDYSFYEDYIEDKEKYNEELQLIKDSIINKSYSKLETYVYKNVNIGFHAKTSTDRYFKGYDEDEKYYESIYKKEFINSLITVDIAENVLKVDKPDIFLTTHGCYSQWGNFFDYCKIHNIPSKWYVRGETNTIIFDMDLLGKQFEQYIKIKNELDENEKKELYDFMNKRIKGEEGQVRLYEFKIQKNNELIKKFNLNEYDKNYALFPNVPWDLSLLQANIVFKDIFDWIFTTINFFEKNNDKQLLIKIHPSEKYVMQSKKTVLDNIKENYSNLTENITIIPPDTNISPYSLFPFIDAGIVYNGTIGLEMAINEIPVIVSGDAHYGNKGFTYDVKSKTDYEKILCSNLKPIDKKLAELYSYFYLIKSFIPYDYIIDKNLIHMGWNVKSFNDFKENKYLDYICEYILNDNLLQDWT